MSYLSLYRNPAPTFEDVVGQEPVVQTLAICSRPGCPCVHVWARDRKTSLARLLAKG